MNGFYNGLSQEERTVVLPDLKKGKTLYWIWDDKIMPVIYNGVKHGCIKSDGTFHIVCEMKTKQRREFHGIYRRKPTVYVCEKGDKRYFCTDYIGKTIFLTRKDAEKQKKEAHHDNQTIKTSN